jgi:hypothetical protein
MFPRPPILFSTNEPNSGKNPAFFSETNLRTSPFSFLFGGVKKVDEAKKEEYIVINFCEINKAVLIEFFNNNKHYVNSNAVIDQKIKAIRKFLYEAPKQWISLGEIEAIIAIGAPTSSPTLLYTPPVLDDSIARESETSLNSEEMLDGILTVLQNARIEYQTTLNGDSKQTADQTIANTF